MITFIVHLLVLESFIALGYWALTDDDSRTKEKTYEAH